MVTFTVLLAAAGVRTAPSILLKAWETEFGWNRASISLAVAFSFLTFGLGGPFVGTLIDRLGARRMMLGGIGLMRERPTMEAALDQPNSIESERPIRLGAALRTLDFWLLAGTFFVCGYTSDGTIGTLLISHAVEHGITPEGAAGTMSLIEVTNTVGALLSGWLTDRVDNRRLLAAF